MKFHKEGFGIILVSFVICSLIETVILFFGLNSWSTFSIVAFSTFPLGILILVIQFFRLPSRTVSFKEGEILCPADGKVVVIEEVDETEYFHDRRIQISIFMSPLNVHANFNPVSGVIQYAKYHPGLFLVAWHPKSSTDNERTTIVTKTASGKEVLFRQIAGALARRICYYVQPGQIVEGGKEFGFIKFGSRIDILLPLDAKIHVQLNQKVKGQLTKIADL